METLLNKLAILEAYGNIQGIVEWSPNLVASVAIDYFHWSLSSADVVWLSDRLP